MRRRAAVAHLRERFGVSERRACRVVGQPRATQRYQPQRPKRDGALLRRIQELSRRHPRYGYRRIAWLLRREGEAVNRKRVHRLWRQAGLQVPQRQPKRRRVATGENGTVRLRPTRPNHVWSYDFLFDATERGSRLKLMPVLDEYTRECLALVVAHSITSQAVIACLDRLMAVRGAPAFVRSDNGPEFIAKAVKAHLKAANAESRFIDPGAPWQNAYTESFNGKLRDELLAREVFGSLREAEVLVEQWRRHYNERRPHSGLDYQTPAAFAASLNHP